MEHLSGMLMFSNSLFRIVALALYAGAFGVADAATIERISGSPIVITIEGDLEDGDQDEFVRQVLELDDAVVVLNSDGGSVIAGVEIGRAIRLKNLTTLVPDGIRCTSACALAWLGGSPRVAAPKAEIGFHAAYELVDGVAVERGVANALVGAYLSQLGLP